MPFVVALLERLVDSRSRRARARLGRIRAQRPPAKAADGAGLNRRPGQPDAPHRNVP